MNKRPPRSFISSYLSKLISTFKHKHHQTPSKRRNSQRNEKEKRKMKKERKKKKKKMRPAFTHLRASLKTIFLSENAPKLLP